MVVKVDKELCIGCGVCVQTCPEVFEFDDEGKAEVVGNGGCNGCDCEEVADSCPTDAIIVKGEGIEEEEEEEFEEEEEEEEE